jgi:flavin-dependent dehydrogenase
VSASTDVFVVGGGPAGLAAAIAARQHGFRAIVADILRPPIDKACGEGLMPDSLIELARLGVSIASCQQAPFRGIRFVGARHSVEASFPKGVGVGIRRTVLHQALVERARQAGVELLWGVRVGGMRPGAVLVDGRVVHCRWVVGADGKDSRVRRWAGLDSGKEFERRLALRRHFRTAMPPEHVEIHWGESSQAYLTPIAADEMCVAVIGKGKLASFDEELRELPTLAGSLRDAQASSEVRGATTVSNRLARVAADGVALIGDASGSVDAITGEGLALSFRQALSLGDALAAADLSLYQAAHRDIMALPHFMRRAMLLMDKSAVIRRRTLQAFDARPSLFARMLAVHVGELPLASFFAHDLAGFGWHMLTA